MRSTPGRKPRLSRQQILETALAVVDREGLAACSMRRVANELGVEAMSLYNYVASKDDLLDGMAELLVSTIEVAPQPAEQWQAELRALAASYRAVFYAHPAFLPVLATCPMTFTSVPAVLRRALETLARAGLDDTQQLRAVNVLAGLIIGLVVQYIGAPSLTPPAEGTALPMQRAAPQPVPVMLSTEQAEAEFAFGLEVFIAGIAHFARDG